MKRRDLIVAALSLAGTAGAVARVMAADGSATYTDPAQAGPDYLVQGEYAGKAGDSQVGVQVIALGKGNFEAVVFRGGLPGAGWDGSERIRIPGKTSGEITDFQSPQTSWKVRVGGERIFGETDKGDKFAISKVQRKSPTLGATAPAGAVVLFDGSSADAWQNGKLVEGGLLLAGTRTKQSFGDFNLHLEFRTPFMPEARGQARGNSGVYVQDRYEIQVLDSFGLEGVDNECGGIYKQAKPKVNMCLPPLAWQTYDIDFQAARFDDQGNKTKPAVLTVKHNGVTIHDHLELSGVTPGGGKNKEDATPGPIQIQNHGNPVHIRNVWIVEKK